MVLFQSMGHGLPNVRSCRFADRAAIGLQRPCKTRPAYRIRHIPRGRLNGCDLVRCYPVTQRKLLAHFIHRSCSESHPVHGAAIRRVHADAKLFRATHLGKARPREAVCGFLRVAFWRAQSARGHSIRSAVCAIQNFFEAPRSRSLSRSFCPCC